ncbi:transcriptional repressor [Mumia sp. zg.B53]|uniref:Fur family transcriptional regulator n=1 Tax=unclassified Mumia TaxID=2621872 RepID=UPI001C6DE1FB|nr:MULTISPECIES: Fur family transcriptional regulator [unclassified Mumia]MBW9206337.1 transcriptional repressor [Mumia sp. zg.B17]MBW9211369.1 transcriptional repressor [Mumia sp. zg.B21]MBW9215948.1 transcriptional repressor [Mumia sp. zg.B53]
MADTSGPGTGWQAVLRAEGYRLTPQRELVLRAVERLGHATVEEVHQDVVRQHASVNISTVYRTLALLDEFGLIRQVYLTDRTPVYHSTSVPSHVHLSCTGCGQVIDADPDDFTPLAATLVRKHGFAPHVDRLVLSGLCADCRRRESDADPGPTGGQERSARPGPTVEG